MNTIMKKNIFYILISFAFLAMACQKEDNGIKTFDLGTEIYISGSSFSNLDDGMTITVNNPLKNLSQVSVKHLGITNLDDESVDPPVVDLGTVSFTDGEGSIQISPANLGLTEFGETAAIEFTGEFQGTTFSRNKTITYVDPFTIETPDVLENGGESKLYYTIAPVSAEVTQVKVETNLNGQGYTTMSGDWQSEDSIIFNGADYMEGDTLQVRITATSDAGQTAESVSTIGVMVNSFQNTAGFTLTSDSTLAYDLVEHQMVETASAGDSADIVLTGSYTASGVNVGFKSDQNAEFVPVTADVDSVYDLANSVQVSAADFSSATMSVTDVADGDVFMFRTRRSGGEYVYGLLKAVSRNVPNGKLEDASIDFEVKY